MKQSSLESQSSGCAKTPILTVTLQVSRELRLNALEEIRLTDLTNSNMTQRPHRHQKAPPLQIVKRRKGDRATDSRVTASTAEGRVTVLRIAGARRRSRNQEMPSPTKSAEVWGNATSVGVRNTLRTSTVACVEFLSTGLKIARSEELRRVRCWPK